MSTLSFTCENIFPSGCVLYTGKIPSFIGDDDTFPCNAMLDAFLERISDEIEIILDEIDLTGLDPGCLTFNPANVTIKELHAEQIDKLCDHESRILDLEEALANLDISSKTITIDLGCLAPLAEPCENGDNTYSLLSIILVLKSEICSLKEKLEYCLSRGCGGGTSGTSGVSGTSGTSGCIPT